MSCKVPGSEGSQNIKGKSCRDQSHCLPYFAQAWSAASPTAVLVHFASGDCADFIQSKSFWNCLFFWAESCFLLMFCFSAEVSHHGKIFLFGSHWNHLVVNYPDFIRQLANQLSVCVCVCACVCLFVCVCMVIDVHDIWLAGWNISLPTQNDCW